MPVHQITALDDVRFNPYRDLPRKSAALRQPHFIVEGWWVVQRLLASGLQTQSILLSRRRFALLQSQLPGDVDILVIPDELVERLVGYDFHAGVMACGRRPGATERFDVESYQDECLLLVACPYTVLEENLGQIIRTCSAFGATGLLVGRRGADPYARRVVRVSMGNVFHLQIVQSPDLPAELQRLRDGESFEIVASVLDPEACPLRDASRPERMILMLGNEAAGLDRQWLQLATQRVTIPMHAQTDSLNVACAAAVCLYHFARVV